MNYKTTKIFKSKRLSMGSKHANREGDIATIACKAIGKTIYGITFDGYNEIQFFGSSGIYAGQFKNKYKPRIFGKGFVGVGYFNSTSKYYDVWRSILKRCYGDNIPTSYKGCSVCDEWLNFQNFSAWMKSNNYDSSVHQIDKDLLIDENKIYSPETCCILPSKLNSQINSHNMNGLGFSIDKRTNQFIARIKMDDKLHEIGRFRNEHEAVDCYMKAKVEYLESLLIEYSYLDDRIIAALKLKIYNFKKHLQF